MTKKLADIQKGEIKRPEFIREDFSINRDVQDFRENIRPRYSLVIK